jgi:hypothetical protein
MGAKMGGGIEAKVKANGFPYLRKLEKNKRSFREVREN